MVEFNDEDSDDYHPDKFDRRQINRALGKPASGSYELLLNEIHDTDLVQSLSSLPLSAPIRLIAHVNESRRLVFG